MIKDIEFRGKTDDGEWVYGDLMKDPGGFCFIRHFDKFTPDGNEFLKLVQAETIGFHAGLKDKNGKKIFTGDILRFMDADTYSSESGFDWIDVSCVGYVSWDEDRIGLDLSNRASAEIYEIEFETSEVIGNVHDNPEMVKR